MSLREILTVTTILFAVIDIVGSIPALLSKNKSRSNSSLNKRLWFLLWSWLFFLLSENHCLAFFLGGREILRDSRITCHFFLAMEMILGIRLYKDEIPETASIIPVAFPLIAGTGTMTTLLSLRAVYDIPTIIIGIFSQSDRCLCCVKEFIPGGSF